jgi:uncharacterized protein with von Willebrand factor type A (vWA) domain
MANTHRSSLTVGSPEASAVAASSGRRTGLAKLKDLATRAGRWLGLTAPPTLHTRAIKADRFDDMTWDETFEEAPALKELADELREKHDYVPDLLADVFHAAHQTSPQLHESGEMDPSRAVNHQVARLLLEMPEFTKLRAYTASDRYAAAMAVLGQREQLITLLEQAEAASNAARETAEAQQAAAEAAQQVIETMQAAQSQAGPDGAVPDQATQAVENALTAVETADAAAAQAAEHVQVALARATPAMRHTLRAATAKASEQAQQEAELMAAWGVGPGQLERMDFAARAALAQRLAGSRLNQFVDLIGRFRRMASGERARRIHQAPGETVGLVPGDDLSRVLPSELANLAVPALRAIFAVRLVQRQLLTYDTRGEMHAGKGAIIACVDCSGSMRGEREAWAKACALALLDQARAAHRDFVGILFSSAHQIATFSFPAHKEAAIEDVLAFTESFFGGRTDFMAPLDAATDILETSYHADGTQHGDIVLITDGIARITDEWRRQWNERKARLGHRLFGISVATSPGPLDELSDSLRHITDLTAPDPAREIFTLI